MSPGRSARCASALDSPEARLLGPAPLLRLRGRHRAQLLAKTALSARVREPRGGRARERRTGDAPRRSERRRGRRSAVALAALAETDMAVLANCAARTGRYIDGSSSSREESSMRRAVVVIVRAVRALLVRQRAWPAPRQYARSPSWPAGPSAGSIVQRKLAREQLLRHDGVGSRQTLTFIENVTYGWHSTRAWRSART